MPAPSSPDLRALKCPSCAALLGERDLDAARGLAKCGHCGALMALPAASAAPGTRARGEVPLPARIQLEETLRGVVIRRRWFSPMYVVLIPFCLVWNAFLVFWYSKATDADAPWIFVVFPLGHVAVGAYLAYFTLAGLMNTTEIAVEGGALAVRHGPMPWPGQRTLERDSVRQLYSKEKIHRGKCGSHSTYELWTALADGKAVKLAGVGGEADQALYLEQRIERALALPDQPVAGELAR
jgi:hypothetical protein